MVGERGFRADGAVKEQKERMAALAVRSDCRQKAILPPKGGRIALSANERIAEFLDFAIQVKFAYVNKLKLSRFYAGAFLYLSTLSVYHRL